MQENKMNIHVRKMTAADTDAVRLLYIHGWQNAFRGIVPQDYLDHMNLDHWAPPLEGAYVLTDGKQLLGTSSLSAARDMAFAGWGEIISLYVRPELIGQGYGHTLFEFAVKRLQSLGHSQIYLTVFEENMRARSFYEKHGFSWNGERLPFNVGGKDLIELRYVLGA